MCMEIRTKLFRYGFMAIDLFNTVLVICRCSVLCVIICFFNQTALYLFPLAMVIDWCVFQYSIQSVFKNQLLGLNMAIDGFKERNVELEIIEDDFIREIDTEMRKYQLFKWGNRHGEKHTIVIRANKMLKQFKSFTFYNASSVVFVSKTFYPQSVKDRILLVHEFAHCVSHDLMLAFRKHFYCSAIIFVVLVCILGNSIWIILFTVIFAILLSLLQFWPVVYNEIEANNHALEVMNTLYGVESMSESAKYLLKLRTETLQKMKNEKRYGLAYATEKLQIEQLQRCVAENVLIGQISPMNFWLSIIYYGLFALVGYACASFIEGICISWYMLIVALMIFVPAYIMSKINITRIWILKDLIYMKIGIQ